MVNSPYMAVAGHPLGLLHALQVGARAGPVDDVAEPAIGPAHQHLQVHRVAHRALHAAYVARVHRVEYVVATGKGRGWGTGYAHGCLPQYAPSRPRRWAL